MLLSINRSRLMATAIGADPAFRRDVLNGLSSPAAGNPGPLVLRPRRLRTLRGHHGATRVLCDPDRVVALIQRG